MRSKGEVSFRASHGVKVPTSPLMNNALAPSSSRSQIPTSGKGPIDSNFELVDSVVTTRNSFPPLFASISASFTPSSPQTDEYDNGLFFARVGLPRSAPSISSTVSTSAATKKVEYYTTKKVQADGRCMFRALVLGMAANRGVSLRGDEETQEADELRMAVADALCRGDKRRTAYEEALIAITVEESLNRYCQRIQRPDFWGGEAELLVLSRMCAQTVVVYIPESKARQGARWGSGFLPIAEYGSEFSKAGKERKARKPVRLLYNGSDHYDLLL